MGDTEVYLVYPLIYTPDIYLKFEKKFNVTDLSPNSFHELREEII